MLGKTQIVSMCYEQDNGGMIVLFKLKKLFFVCFLQCIRQVEIRKGEKYTCTQLAKFTNPVIFIDQIVLSFHLTRRKGNTKKQTNKGGLTVALVRKNCERV